MWKTKTLLLAKKTNLRQKDWFKDAQTSVFSALIYLRRETSTCVYVTDPPQSWGKNNNAECKNMRLYKTYKTIHLSAIWKKRMEKHNTTQSLSLFLSLSLALSPSQWHCPDTPSDQAHETHVKAVQAMKHSSCKVSDFADRSFNCDWSWDHRKRKRTVPCRAHVRNEERLKTN